MFGGKDRLLFKLFALASVVLVITVRGNQYYQMNFGDVSAITRATPVSQRADLARRGAPPPPDYWENPDKYEPFRLMDLFKCD